MHHKYTNKHNYLCAEEVAFHIMEFFREPAAKYYFASAVTVSTFRGGQLRSATAFLSTTVHRT